MSMLSHHLKSEHCSNTCAVIITAARRSTRLSGAMTTAEDLTVEEVDEIMRRANEHLRLHGGLSFFLVLKDICDEHNCSIQDVLKIYSKLY